MPSLAYLTHEPCASCPVYCSTPHAFEEWNGNRGGKLTLLSISKPFKGTGRANYYLNLARQDYYLSGKEPPGFWIGDAAKRLGLSGLVKSSDFRNLLAGLSADSKERLVHNACSPNRRSAWDLTWSVPKSVSVAWSQAPPTLRLAIEREVREAVRRAISYIETIGVVSRRGADGVVREEASLLFAAFEHSTSRALDPQLHVHTILINLGVRHNGSTGTIDPREIYRHQLAAGTLFRAELASRLENVIGFRTRREGRAFELIGVPVTLIQEFSKRRAQVEARLKELGLQSAAAAEKAVFDTRLNKESVSRDELLPRWKAVGETHNWSTKELCFVLGYTFAPRNPSREAQLASKAALLSITFSESHFSSRQLLQALAEEAQGRGLDANQVVKLQAELLNSNELTSLSTVRGEKQWTTLEMLRLEKSALDTAAALHESPRPTSAPQKAWRDVAPLHSHLSMEQQRALSHVVSDDSGIRIVSGVAGTGKTTLFRAAFDAWQAQGCNVFGACLSGKAACELSEATCIPTQTIHRTLGMLESGQLRLGERSILLIDEAAMVGTRQMKALLDCCKDASATVILSGDSAQLQSIEAGGVFAELSRRYGASPLTEVRRQVEPWAREAVKAFAQGRTADALKEYAGRGLVTITEEPASAVEHLFADWRKDAMAQPQKALILANRTKDVLALNERAQEERLRAGELSGPGVVIGQTTFHIGDRIVFTRNAPDLGIWNGQTATLTHASNQSVTARLDSDISVSFPQNAYPHVQLAYALTTHKAQGMTVERAFVYIDPTAETREAAYVQASRARQLCSFYAPSESLDKLMPAMARSRPKVLATTLLPEPRPLPSLTLELGC